MLELGIDIGGTFVDGVVFDRQGLKLWHSKVPAHIGPVENALTCLDELLTAAGGSPRFVSRVAHGTTLATNVLIERTGARIAFLTTKGFRDVLEIQRGWRGRQVYDVIGYQRPPSLVPRWLRIGIPERVDGTGDEVDPLDEESLIQAIQFLKKHHVEGIAIGFLHSYKNPSHELRAAALVRDYYPEAQVSVSSQVCPEPREYERFSTCVINAYVQSNVHTYLGELVASLDRIAGPAVIEQLDSTILLPPNSQAIVDSYSNLIIQCKVP